MSDDRRVWKFLLPLHTTGRLELPKGAKLLHIGTQVDSLRRDPEQVYAWFEVDPQAEEVEERRFNVLATGFDRVVPGEVHRGSVVMANGLVWHVYEDPTPAG